MWRSSLKEGGKKIKMWEKYNKKVTNEWEASVILDTFPGPLLTPSGFQQRKPQMEKIPQAVINALEHQHQRTLESI